MTRNVLLLFLTAVLTGTLLAGTTGKIAGVVKDKKSGEPLIGANVKIDGQPYGAATDIDGRYTILNLPPGTYTLAVSMMGYDPVRISNVQVRIDLTTTQDVEMGETVLQQQEVIIVAERPLVQKDLTAKTAIVSGKEISDLPVTEIGAVLSLQAGMVAGSLRGGRKGEVAYWVDGIPLTDGFNGEQVVEVNKSLVQEMQLVSGAFNAEYGQAMSGIVNISTREGGPKFNGGIGFYGGDYLVGNDSLFPGLEFNPLNIRNFEGNFGGPILGEDLTFFMNARHIYFNGYLNGYRRFHPWNIGYTDNLDKFHLSRDPDGMGDSAAVSMNWSKRTYLQGKVAWRLTGTAKLTANYIHDFSVNKGYNFRYFYNPDGAKNYYNTSNTLIMQYSQNIGTSTFFTVGASVFDKRANSYLYGLEYRDSSDAVTGEYLGKFEVWNPKGPHYVHTDLFIPYDSYSFFTGGTENTVDDRKTTTGLVKFDLTSQIDQMNLVKVGIEFRSHKIFNSNVTLQPVLSQSSFSPATSSPFIRTFIPPISSNNHNEYTRKPTEFSAYIQDKMEFKDIIVNLGVRFDYFKPDGQVLADPSDPSIYNPIKVANRFRDANANGIQDSNETSVTVADRMKYWYKNATAKSAISPRLGVSFPITATGIVHFSYGHFFQIPRFERLYDNPFFKIGLGTGNQGIVGNADLEPEQTISGEIGVQQQIGEDISLDVTAYMRDIRNLTGTRGEEIIVFGGASKYSRYTNSDFGFIKGIIVTVDKRFIGGFSASLDYTYQVAEGSASDPADAQRAIAGGSLPEVQLNPLGWDQRHTINTTVSYTADVWGASVIGQFGSGTPYTPRSSTDISTILANSQLKPSFFNVDMRAFYNLRFGDIGLVFFTRIFNLFDIRNETNVFNDSGRAGFTVDMATAIASRPREYVNKVDDFYTRPTNYSEPRRLEFGVNVEF